MYLYYYCNCHGQRFSKIFVEDHLTNRCPTIHMVYIFLEFHWHTPPSFCMACSPKSSTPVLQSVLIVSWRCWCLRGLIYRGRIHICSIGFAGQLLNLSGFLATDHYNLYVVFICDNTLFIYHVTNVHLSVLLYYKKSAQIKLYVNYYDQIDLSMTMQ